MTWLIRVARELIRDERGASLGEYAILLSLVAVICLGAITAFGTAINGFFNAFASTI